MTSSPKESSISRNQEGEEETTPLSRVQFRNIVTYLLFHLLPESYLKEMAPQDAWNPVFIQYNQHAQSQLHLKLTKSEKKRIENELMDMKRDYQRLCLSLDQFVAKVFNTHDDPSMNPYRVSCVAGNWKRKIDPSIVSPISRQMGMMIDYSGLSEDEDEEQKEERMFLENEREKIDRIQALSRSDSASSTWTATPNGLILFHPTHSFYFDHDARWKQRWQTALDAEKMRLTSASQLSAAWDSLCRGEMAESFSNVLTVSYTNDDVSEDMIPELEKIEFVAQFPFRVYLYLMNEVQSVPLAGLFVGWIKTKKKEDHAERFDELLNRLVNGDDMMHLFHQFNKKWSS